jgi:hypothetical protein
MNLYTWADDYTSEQVQLFAQEFGIQIKNQNMNFYGKDQASTESNSKTEHRAIKGKTNRSYLVK